MTRNRNRRVMLSWIVSFFTVSAPLVAQTTDSTSANQAGDTSAQQMKADFEHREQIRMECIEGRRLICGKILQILPDGFVVESGYTNLLREPLVQSWLAPGN